MSAQGTEVAGAAQASMSADAPATILACVALALASFAAFMGMPMVVGALISQLGYSSAQGGLVASTEYLGMFSASSLAAFILVRLGARRMAAYGLALALAADLASPFLSALPGLLTARFLAGLGCGCGYAVAVAVLTGSTHTSRNFMLLIFGQVLTNAAIVYLFPSLLERWQLASLFLSYALILVIASLGIGKLPRHRALEPDAAVSEGLGTAPGVHPDGTRVPGHLPWLCLFAVFSFYLMIGAYWAYIEVMGMAVGLSADFIGKALAVGILLSLGACLIAYRMGSRLGQSRTLLLALAVVALTQIAAGLFFGPVAYLLGLGIVNCFWNFTDIFQLSTLAKLDRSGVFPARVQGAQMLALTVSPASAGWLLDRQLGYGNLLILIGGCVAVAFATYAYVYRALHRHAPQLADAA